MSSVAFLDTGAIHFCACKAGEKIHILTCGGDGYGNPGERSRDSIVDDVRQGYVSVAAASEHYGVAMDPAEADLKT